MEAINETGLAQMRRHNKVQAAQLIFGMAVILGLVGWVWFGAMGVMAALLGVALIWVMSSRSSNAVLKMYKARPIGPNDAPALVEAIDELSRRAELSAIPKLYWVPSKVPNAFATGSDDNSVIAVSEGLLLSMGRREIVSILAHEVSHLRNGDVRVMMFADAISRIVGMFGRLAMFMLVFGGLSTLMGSGGFGQLAGVVVLFLAPTATTLLQLGLSRTREYNADLGAVELTGDPDGLISALKKLEQPNSAGWERVLKPQGRESAPAALRTHPLIEDRVARLERMRPNAVPPREYVDEVERPEFEEVVGIDKSDIREPKYHITNGLRY